MEQPVIAIPSNTVLREDLRHGDPLVTASKTPGPGAYVSARQFPKQSPAIARMGREHSLFFNNTIGF
ncbi:hypothetical protein GW7_18574 [Heterocephalus glaber]|uniref:Uncharacterized protein n=1 Tax=Heterocephalus glaber TaxID=10181 RepID=G5C9S5_HETGA|nr:hypothetical protein GW7_18574 [Heterocephalus glaber]